VGFTNLSGTNLNVDRKGGGPGGAKGRMPGVNPSTPTSHFLASRFHPRLKRFARKWLGGQRNPVGFTNLSGTNLNVDR
jgi:hypothetical protein